MKPVYLEFCGINSFSERAVIDFNKLLEFGIFGIFGDTGSGKSTVLDCIGFALYGGVARSRSGSIADIINYRSDKASVVFEFEILYEGERRRFRVERELKRKNAAQSVKLYERKGDALLCVADGVRESNALLEKIVGLEQRDFEKCIALPQGEFAQFVKSQRGDRLKLISRLFDLEQYGEGLTKRVNARCARSRAEAEIAEAKLEPYACVSQEGNGALSEEIAALEKADAQLVNGIALLKEEEKRLSALFEKCRERGENARRLARLEGEKSAVDTLEGELIRLEKAAPAVDARAGLIGARNTLGSVSSAFERSAQELERASAAEKAAAEWNAEKADEEIAALTGMRARAEAFEENAKRVKDLRARLGRVRADYAAEREIFKDFDYAAERDDIESNLARLGEGDFIAFAENYGKAALLRGEYAEFAKEIGRIAQKYPETEPDTLPLEQKYRALAEGDRTDFNQIKREFEALERARKTEREKLLLLEKRNGSYKAHCEKLQQLHTEGIKLKQELEEAEKLPVGDMQLARIDGELAQKKRIKREMTAALETARRNRAEAEREYAANGAKKDGALQACKEAEKRLELALAAGGFSSAEEAAALLEKYGEAETAREQVKKFRDEYAAATAREKELSAYPAVTEEELTAAQCALGEKEKERRSLSERLVLCKSELARNEAALAQKRELEKEYGAARKRADLFERLKKLFEGNKFMEYAAEEYLQTVALNASGRLLSLTDGRYFLRYDGGFFVGDNFNGGALRGVYTLSGGETFLVSLSLALALSAEICQKSLRPVEFFFLDEGFGTLDEKLVDTVMDSLEKLKSENFSIGIISHVEELKHRIERRLLVKKATEKHGSQIQTE